MSHRPIRTLLALSLSVPIMAAATQPSSWVLSILGISFLIFIHEWGHFTACRLTGTRTETFSIGFGPRLFGWEKDRDGKRRFTVGRRQLDPADHAMDFRIAAVPLGGYVKMAGEIPAQGGVGEAAAPAPDEFPAKSAWARTFIISAGVIMNFITAIVFYTIAVGAGKSFVPPVVGHVVPGGAAWSGGLRPGDRVLEIGGNDTPTWLDLRMEVAFAAGNEAAPVIVERNGKVLPSIPVTPTTNEKQGILAFGVGAAATFRLGEGENAFEIGAMETGTVNGRPVSGGADAHAAWELAFQFGQLPIQLENARGDHYTFNVVPPGEGETPDKDLSVRDPGVREIGIKVGIAPYVRPTVTSLRSEAAKVLLIDDVLLAVRSAGARTPVVSVMALYQLPFRSSIDALIVLRDAKELTLEVGLATHAAVAGFFDQVVFTTKRDTRVVPLASGHLLLAGPHIYRYPSAPALEAGLPAGARLTKVGTVITRDWTDITKAVEGAKVGEPISFTYKTLDGKEATREITPLALEYVGTVGPVVTVPLRDHWQSPGLGASIATGAGRMVRETKNVFRTIGSLFAGTINFNKNIAGPVTLISVSSEVAERDTLDLIWFLAYVSVMLAVLNILPIPVLDGGHLMFILIEKIKGAPLKDETIYRFQQVGFLMLLVLMGFAFKNDFVRLFDF